jgi:zinc transport system substrate-binding protein
MILKRALTALVVVGVGTGAAACSSGSGSGATVTVAASFFPLAEVARAVGGDHVRVVDLTPKGTEPHDVDLAPSQVGEVQRADVVLYLGHGFQPTVQDLATARGDRAVDGLGHLAVVDDDPHVWLDPTMLSRIVTDVQMALSQRDSSHRDSYAANAEKYRVALSRLDRQMGAGLASCDRNIVVTSHAAFRYLTARYGLEQEAVAGVSPDSEPPPARLAELAKLVPDAGVTTIFVEPLVQGGPAASLAAQTGTRTATLDPIEGALPNAVGASYFELMGRNLTALRAALGCA